MAERDFKTIQYEFCAYLRDPTGHPPLPGVARQRLALYRELVYRNVEDALARTLPTLRSLLVDPVWQDIVSGFLANHLARTPIYSRMAEEFLVYLAAHDTDVTWPPFLLELARYEWSKAQVLSDPRESTECAIEAGLGLVDGCVMLNPVLIAASYRFPVHHLGPGLQLREAPATPSYLVVWRHRDDRVGFMELNAVAARLLQLLQLDDGRSGAELLELIALELKHPTPAAVIEGGREILQSFLDKDIVLGARRRS